MSGSATFTIVMSSSSMNVPRHTAASDTTPAANAMIAATRRMRSRPVVKAARVIVPTTCLAGAGSRAITLPICPDCTAPAISGPRADSPGTAAVRVSTSSFTSLENSVPSRAMPVAMPTWRKVELMPEAMPACCGGTTPTAVEASGGFTRPTPTPATIIPGMRWVQVEPALSPRISSRLTPMMIRPGPISSRTGTREESLPATVALTRMAPDRYITRTPVPSGE